MFIVHLSFRYLNERKKNERKKKKDTREKRKEECNDLLLSFSPLLLM
jgi:hypothetical protein